MLMRTQGLSLNGIELTQDRPKPVMYKYKTI